jgi:hypothetical protein
LLDCVFPYQLNRHGTNYRIETSLFDVGLV